MNFKNNAQRKAVMSQYNKGNSKDSGMPHEVQGPKNIIPKLTKEQKTDRNKNFPYLTNAEYLEDMAKYKKGYKIIKRGLTTGQPQYKLLKVPLSKKDIAERKKHYPTEKVENNTYF